MLKLSTLTLLIVSIFTSDMRQSKTLLTIDEPQGRYSEFVIHSKRGPFFRIQNYEFQYLFRGGGVVGV